MIRHNGKTIAFYSRKLTETQNRYTVTERELLSIVKTKEEYRTILLGQQLKIFTDHKNLTCKKCNTYRVLGWGLIVEYYSL